MHPTINWIISTATLGYIVCFDLNLLSFSIRLSLISVLNQFRDRYFISFSNFDYSANSNPNHSIFDSVDLQLSYLS